MNNASVWLAYVSLPYTTAAYYERALRRSCQTFTIGPRPTEELISRWNLESIRSRIKSHDLETSYQPDMAAICKQYSNILKPSLYLWIESAGGHFPINLDAIRCPKACIFIDSHVNLDYQLEWAKNFDYIFVAQLAYVQDFKNKGLNAHWLPLAADSEIHCRIETPKIHEVSMVGSIFPNTRRFDLIEKIQSKFSFYTERCFLEDMTRVYSTSKIVFNNAIKDDLNMRVFEAMATGSLLLTDMAKGSGQDELFKDDEDYALYQDDNILEKIGFYLSNNSKREQIALNGRKLVHSAHLYSHRVEDLLNVVLGKKAQTFSAAQLRELSLGKRSFSLEASEEQFSASEVSYVIPVLDYSPASPFNIKTLLEDLADAPGDVIVIFNNEKVANELKHHPRINEYSILKHNVGVSRAWNIGLNISRTPYTFILNSDLKVSLKAISQLLSQIKTLDRAAIVGPQGAFFNFETLTDYYFFNKGSFNKSIEVDAVSGFFFVVNNKLFNENGLAFDNRYTPCYREEWDIGLQIKRANLRCYIAPVTDYDHHWSGSIRSYKKIRFYDQEQTPQEILERTGNDFQAKWQAIAQQQPSGFLDSGWKLFSLKMIEHLVGIGRQEQAQKVIDLLLTQFAGDKEVFASAGIVAYHANQWQQAKEYFSKALLIDPQYVVAIKNMQLIAQRHEGK